MDDTKRQTNTKIKRVISKTGKIRVNNSKIVVGKETSPKGCEEEELPQNSNKLPETGWFGSHPFFRLIG